MEILPPPVTPQATHPPNDNVFIGCAMGCLCQIVFWLIGFGAAMAMDKHPTPANILYVSFGVTQWIVIAPLIWQQRKRGYRSRVQGLIITGCIGVLLSSACAMMIKFE